MRRVGGGAVEGGTEQGDREGFTLAQGPVVGVLGSEGEGDLVVRVGRDVEADEVAVGAGTLPGTEAGQQEELVAVVRTGPAPVGGNGRPEVGLGAEARSPHGDRRGGRGAGEGDRADGGDGAGGLGGADVARSRTGYSLLVGGRAHLGGSE